MIELQASQLVGKGLHRECYVHPDDDNLCIKVVVNRGEEETRREQAYYKFLQKRNVIWEMLPKFYGEVDTNLGSGAVFDLIRDADGSVSKTLEHYIESPQLTEVNFQGLLQSLLSLKEYLITQNIMTMTIKPKNIVYKKQEAQSGLCIIIDNIGNSDLLSISSYSRFFGRKKINRKWTKFITSMQKHYPDNQSLHRILAVI